MKSIWKYQIDLTDIQVISMPRGAEVLSLQEQNGALCMWALVDTNAEPTDRTFQMYGTGHPCTSNAGEFIGTFQVRGGSLVFHVFESK